MIIREITPSEQTAFDALVDHPQQSSAWAEFRRSQGLTVIQLGIFSNNKLKQAWQIFVHPLPNIPLLKNKTILYCPKGPLPDAKIISATRDYAKKHNAIFVKFEPQHLDSPQSQHQLKNLGLKPGRSLYTPYNFLIDLTKSDDQLLADMKPKTRYNLKLAQKRGVTVIEDNSPAAYESFLQLTAETTHRQKFYAHTENYHRLLWQTLQPRGIAHLLVAKYQSQILTTWILFKWKNTLYYPYGASSRLHPEVMANHFVMWSAIQLGKQLGCTQFDLWGTAGSSPKPTDRWYGFHHFKHGFNPHLVKYVGTYDLIIDPILYPVITTLDTLRQTWMRIKANFTPNKF